MLVIVKDDLEDALLLESLILILLILRLKSIDWAVKLFFRESLRIDGRSAEHDIVCNLQSLGHDL